MAIQNKLVTEYPLVKGAQVGVVEEFTEAGLIVVSKGAISVACHFVRSSTVPPEIKIGDSVLYLPPSSADETGYVLGLVEPYKPKANRLVDKLSQHGKTPEITTIEDEVVRIKADKGLVIECGKGTIIITQDGKVQIKGTELLSRARGMNRIKGAGVNIN